MATKCVLNKSTMTGIADAIRAKGGTAASILPSAMPAAIAAIPTGAPFGHWEPPSDWPDIRKILTDNWPANTDYDAACIYLLTGNFVNDATFGGTVTYIKNSNGAVNTSSNSNMFTRSDTGLRWVAKYGYHNGITIANGGTKTNALWGHFNNVHFSANPDAISYCSALQAFTGNVTCDYSGILNFQNDSSLRTLFTINLGSGCSTRPYGLPQSLMEFQSVFDFSGIADCSYTFDNVSSLINVPDVIDLSSCENCSGMFNSLSNLRKFPTHLTANGSHSLNINFNGVSWQIIDRESFAKFDDNGNIVGGMVYNLNDMTGAASPPTLTLSSTLKNNLFTQAQRDAIVALVHDTKNWTLNW